MPDWKKSAAAREMTIDDAVARTLDALEREMARVRASLEWRDEPAVIFRAGEEEDAQS